MSKYLKYINRLLSLITLLWVCQSVYGQAANNSTNCGPSLESFADSLELLNLAHRTSQVMELSDSLLDLYNDKICPEALRIKAARANAFELLLDFETALDIYNAILPIAQNLEYYKEEANIRISLARVYEWAKREEQSEEQLAIAKTIIDNHGYLDVLSRYCVRYSSFLRIFGRDKTLANEYAHKAVKLGLEYKVIRSVADGYLMIGVTTPDLNEAVEAFENASNTFFSMGDEIGAMFQLLNVADIHHEIRQYDQSIIALNRIDEFAESIDDNEKVYFQFKSEIAIIRAKIYEKLDEKDNQIQALKNANDYSAKLGAFINQEKINELIVENAVKEEQAKVLNAERNIRFLGLGILSLLAALLMLVRSYRYNRSQKIQIEEQTDIIKTQYEKLEGTLNYQTTLLSEVHHRIKNNLQLIISLLTLQKAKLGNDIDTGILDMLNQRIGSISLIHEQLYNFKEFDLVDVELYVNDLLKNFKSLSKDRNIDIDYDIDQIKLNLETITPLGLIWSELVNNSFKYNVAVEELTIYFSLKREGDFYLMHYHDNGIGYPEGEFKPNQKGMGHTIIQSLSRQLSAEYSAYNDNGAHFTLKFQEKIISPL